MRAYESYRLRLYSMIILLVCCRVETSSERYSIKQGVNATSPNISSNTTTSSQYFFVPAGSFLQFSLDNWEMGQNGAYLNQMSINYTITIQNTVAPNYNFIVLPSPEDLNPTAVSLFNCYVRAVNEGVGQLMSACNFSYAPNPNGICAPQISSLTLPLSPGGAMFTNCTDTQLQFNFNLYGDANQLDGTLLFIVDNSGLFPNTTQSSQMINLIVSYALFTTMDEGDRAQFYLFCVLCGIVILLLIILACVLNCKIRRIDKLIDEEKKDKVL